MRPQDWPALLDGYIEQARRTPFAWGVNDCVTFSCGWHSLMTARDVHAPLRGHYDNETAAFRIMLEHGVHGMEEAGRFLFGEPRPLHGPGGNAFIGRGDIVYAEGALGICAGASGAFLSKDGLTFLRHDKFELGWSL